MIEAILKTFILLFITALIVVGLVYALILSYFVIPVLFVGALAYLAFSYFKANG